MKGPMGAFRRLLRECGNLPATVSRRRDSEVEPFGEAVARAARERSEQVRGNMEAESMWVRRTKQ